ncbi:MAG: hydrogenase expression/formation C-terminal domain-containing protein [Lamprobacter sp.]|uniref:hydrogenase expression/formation C-terminal domain-containing protein n=1 Tax=Lamprobacter sp. TaxID=3100796 RepID=UPI002B25BC20|nr:hydrogenase expression/formation C-terminal domain-containing protein [Lamprobacter sp.]MEA3639595.1 hydrogenase expression/formation C-terminal domain-containing protein [Lamprobacter sp.]
MAELAGIPIHIEQPETEPQQYGNALPILNEIRHALERFAQSAEPTRIDLAAMPFGPGDEARLMALLGRGEVEATIDALGPTRVWETRFPGVWILDYANVDGERIALQIEVDEIPQMLRTQRADMTDSLAALDAALASVNAADPAAESRH